jgi:hypothetical protein
MDLLVSLWKNNALVVWQKYLNNCLPKEGIFNCPREFVLRHFSKDDFEYLTQNQNKTYYKLKNFTKTP